TRENLKTITDTHYQKHPKTFLTHESYMNDYSEEINETGIDKLERMKYNESYWE
ncbi:replication protein, partial [Staphylococcus aureus]